MSILYVIYNFFKYNYLHMLELFLFINFIPLIMLIWLKSEAIIEWGSLFGLSKILKIDEFYKMKFDELPLEITYPTFLKIKYNNFITKLLACPLCLSVWLSIIFCLIISILTSHLLFLIFIPTTCIFSLIVYGIITKLIKLS